MQIFAFDVKNANKNENVRVQKGRAQVNCLLQFGILLSAKSGKIEFIEKLNLLATLID